MAGMLVDRPGVIGDGLVNFALGRRVIGLAELLAGKHNAARAQVVTIGDPSRPDFVGLEEQATGRTVGPIPHAFLTLQAQLAISGAATARG